MKSALSDGDLRRLLLEDPDAGWRVFIDQFTPRLISAIEQAGLRERDEIMDLYVLTCEHLAADDCARLRRHDPSKGALGAWLGTVVRRLLVDWVRSEKGRKRLFGSIRALSTVDRRVFEAYYWRRQTPAEMADRVRDDEGRPIGLAEVFGSLERVERALTPRQRSELLLMAGRTARVERLESEAGELAVDPVAAGDDPEAALDAAERRALLDRALGALSAEDRVIVAMRYEDGLTLSEIRRALHLEQLTGARVQAILERLRMNIEAATTPGEERRQPA
ncbi:MAG: hypothetical protein AB1635_17365 [Acidobacteriota bacterium]